MAVSSVEELSIRRQGPDTTPLSEDDILLALIRADTFLLIAAAAATSIHSSCKELEDYVILQRRTYYDEIPAPKKPFEPWEPLPAPALPDLWDI
jgi:hypothetical protein